MTNLEFSNEFDTLISSCSNQFDFGEGLSKADFVFDEYEKSVFLTKAQEELVKELYSSNYTSFEANEESRRQLDSLVKLTKYENTYNSNYYIEDKFQHNIYELPNDCWYIVYELAKLNSSNLCLNESIVDIVPVTHDDYYRTINNPFRGPNNRRVLRLDSGSKKVELVSKYNITQYLMRYISLPEPIILGDLDDGVEINGFNNNTECKLNKSLHRNILERAIKIAISTKLKEK